MRARSANPSSRPSPLNEIPVKETNPDQHRHLEKTISPPDIYMSLFQIGGWGLRFPCQFIKAHLTGQVSDATRKCSPSLSTAPLGHSYGQWIGCHSAHTSPAKESQELPIPQSILYFLERKAVPACLASLKGQLYLGSGVGGTGPNNITPTTAAALQSYKLAGLEGIAPAGPLLI